MAKLKENGETSKIRPELIKLIHDKVISLCQKKYASFEVDGLICITLLDTKEQQVVKIHKTLKSVNGDPTKEKAQPKKKTSAYPSIAAILSSSGPDTPSDRGSTDTNITEENSLKQPLYRNEIERLSNLLQASSEINQHEYDESSLPTGQTQKKSKRKKHNRKKVTEKTVEAMPAGEKVLNSGNPDDNTDSHIIIKQEPINDDFGITENEPHSSLHTNDTTDLLENNEARSDIHTDSTDLQQAQVMGYESINDSCSSSDNSDEPKTNSVRKEGGVAYSTLIDTVINETIKGKDKGNKASDEDIFASYLTNNSDFQKNTSDGTNQKHSEWLYNLAQRSLIESGNISGSDSNSNDSFNKIAKNKTPPQRERGRQKCDPLGRGWFEMIQNNANRYQAALMRSGIIGKTGEESPTPATNAKFEHLRGLLNDRQGKIDSVASMMGPEHAENNIANLNETEHTHAFRDNIALCTSGSEKSRSISPAPVVKIEVDEQVPMFPDQDLAKKDKAVTDKPTKDPAPRPQGKLESRYPALFNQLQQPKRDATPNLDQSDSLLNRLPFISFQEIFSQSGQTNSKTSNETGVAAKTLIEKGKKILDEARGRYMKRNKTVWNWKKRFVRPKDSEGNIMNDLPAGPPVSFQFSNRSVGMNNLAKRSFAKKRQKGLEEEDDTEWTPSSDKKIKSSAPQEGEGVTVSTRHSSRDRRKIDFTEIDESEPDDGEEAIDITGDNQDIVKDEPIELVSAYCRYQCGRRFETFGELAEHEDLCESKLSGKGEDGEGGKILPDGHKCEICGLDFNQEYRFKYHMVKVHGITVDTDKLFR